MLFLLSLVKTLNTSSLLIIHLLVNILNFKVIIINMESLVAGVVAGLRHKLAPAAAIRPGARAPPACFPCLSLCLHGCNCNGSNRRVTGSSNYHNAATGAMPHSARASQYHILLLSSNNGSFVAEWGAQKTGKNEF